MSAPIDYVEMIQRNRETNIGHAANAPALTPVLYANEHKLNEHKHLTKRLRRGSLKKARSHDESSERSHDNPRAEILMAKGKKKGRKSGSGKGRRKLTAKQKAAGFGGKRAMSGKRSKKRSGKTSVKSPRKRARKAKAAAPEKKRSKAKRRHTRSVKAAKKRGRKRVKTTVRTTPRRGGGTTFNVRVTGATEHPRRSRGKTRRGKRRATESPKRSKGRRGYHPRRHRGAMENPLSGAELFVGSIFGLVGFGVGDFIDRVLSSHALTDKNTKDANGHELYADNPDTTGDYAGLFNATAICSPMDWKRWLVGLGAPAVLFTTAHFISAPMGRSSFQFAGFGWGVRVVGKGMIDGIAMLTKWTGMGQRLYDGEMRAAALKSGGAANPELASLPSAGLGKPKQLGNAHCAECAKRAQGAGAAPAGYPPPPPTTPPGAGWPSMPRETAPNIPPAMSTSQHTPQPPQQPQRPPVIPPAVSVTNRPPIDQLLGPPNGARRNPLVWGDAARDMRY